MSVSRTVNLIVVGCLLYKLVRQSLLLTDTASAKEQQNADEEAIDLDAIQMTSKSEKKDKSSKKSKKGAKAEHKNKEDKETAVALPETNSSKATTTSSKPQLDKVKKTSFRLTDEEEHAGPKKSKSKRSKLKKSYDSDVSSGDDKFHASRSKSHVHLYHKRNQVGEIIYKGHPSWVLMQNIQTGIRHCVGREAEVLPLSDLEKLKHSIESHASFFASPDVIRFPPEGSATTQPHSTGLFKFKDYCPLVFRRLRQKFGIDAADYMVSLCNTLPDGSNALRELPTPGKSGSLFFFSHDMKYILKTIPKREAKLLRFLLPAYYTHVMENPSTLLPRFFGLHRVKPHKGRQVRFVVMGNIFVTNKKIHQRFDLKGSTLGRQVSEEEKTAFKDNVTYKDIDWRNAGKKLHLGPLKKAFVEQLQRDCALLAKLNIMDYSLLIGIHNCEINNGADCSTACKKQFYPPFVDADGVPYSPKVKEEPKRSKSKYHKHSKSKRGTHDKESKKRKESKKDEESTEEQPKAHSKEVAKENGNEKQTDVHDSKQYEKESKQEEEGVTTSLPDLHEETPDRRTSNSQAHKAQTNFTLPEDQKAVSMFNWDDGGMRGIDEKGQYISEHYYVGIIDILMLYSVRKKLEHAYKALRYNSDKDGISAINPSDYAKRFETFIADAIL